MSTFHSDENPSPGGSASAASARSTARAATPLDDPAVAPLLAQSATLRAGLAVLNADGYAVEWGAAGMGAYYDARNRRIVVDSNAMGDGERVVRSLSHELGHHKFKEPQEYSSRSAYVHRQLRNEGAATLENSLVRAEILAAGGPDIGVSGRNSAAYERITGEYLAGRIDRDSALNRIVGVFGAEVPSTDPTKNYLDYYGDHYDAKIVPWLKSIGKIPEPISDVQSDLDRGHPAAGMYASLRRQFAAEVSDATVLAVAVKAQESGIKAGDAELRMQGDRVWVFSSQTPGFRLQADLTVPPPSVQESLERSAQLDGQQVAQQQMLSGISR